MLSFLFVLLPALAVCTPAKAAAPAAALPPQGDPSSCNSAGIPSQQALDACDACCKRECNNQGITCIVRTPRVDFATYTCDCGNPPPPPPPSGGQIPPQCQPAKGSGCCVLTDANGMSVSDANNAIDYGCAGPCVTPPAGAGTCTAPKGCDKVFWGTCPLRKAPPPPPPPPVVFRPLGCYVSSPASPCRPNDSSCKSGDPLYVCENGYIAGGFSANVNTVVTCDERCKGLGAAGGRCTVGCPIAPGFCPTQPPPPPSSGGMSVSPTQPCTKTNSCCSGVSPGGIDSSPSSLDPLRPYWATPATSVLCECQQKPGFK